MKKLIAGIAAGFLLGTASMAVAATSPTVQALVSKVTFSVDGEKKPLKSDPLLYNGTTYLPVREVAGLTGYELDYNAKAKTIDLKQKGGSSVSTTEEINLEDYVPARDAATKHGVKVTIGSENTKVERGDVVLVFPLTKTSGIASEQSVPKVYKSEGGKATLVVENSTIYLGTDTLSLLGIGQ